MCIEETDVTAAGNPEVGVARLPRSVHCAAHDRNLERLRVSLESLLDDDREALDTNVVSATRRARDHHGATFAQPEGLENLPRDLDLLDRVGCERDAEGVTDAVCKK